MMFAAFRSLSSLPLKFIKSCSACLWVLYENAVYKILSVISDRNGQIEGDSLAELCNICSNRHISH